MKYYTLILLFLSVTLSIAFPEQIWRHSAITQQHLSKRTSPKRPASALGSNSPPSRSQRQRHDSPPPESQPRLDRSPSPRPADPDPPNGARMFHAPTVKATVKGPALVTTREPNMGRGGGETIHEIESGQTETVVHRQARGGRMRIQNLRSSSSAMVETQGRKVRSDVTPRTNARKTDIRLEGNAGNDRVKLRTIHAATSATTSTGDLEHPVKMITTLQGRGRISTKARNPSPGKSSESSGFSDSGSDISPSPSPATSEN